MATVQDLTYLLTECSDRRPSFYSTTDLSQYVGRVITVEDFEGCYTVTPALGLLKAYAVFAVLKIDSYGQTYEYLLPIAGTVGGSNYYFAIGDNYQVEISYVNGSWQINSPQGIFTCLSDSETITNLNWVAEMPYTSVEVTTQTMQNGCIVFGNNTLVEIGVLNGKPAYYYVDEEFVQHMFYEGGYWITFGEGFTYELDSNVAVPISDAWQLVSGIGNPTETSTVCEPSIEDVDVLQCFEDCEDCSKPVYRLVDCQDNYPDILTSDVRFADLVDNYVKIPYYNNHCFLVISEQYSHGEIYTSYTDFSAVYASCVSCYQQDYVEPITEIGCCDTEKVVDVLCSFADAMYQQMMSKRLGIKFCCPVEKEKYTVKKSIIDHQLLCADLPELPEPYIEPCCIPIIPNCIPKPCGPCNDSLVPVIEEDCNCTASPNSPHDCHQYVLKVSDGQLELAVGNEEEYFNGKIFFGYYKCKDTKPTFNVYTETTTEQICVLGIPLFGYYNNDEWITLTAQRGAVCEPAPITNCPC